MTVRRTDQGSVRMPEREFEAILVRAAEEGAKRALAEARGQGGCSRHPRPAFAGGVHALRSTHGGADVGADDHHGRDAGAPRRDCDQAQDLRRQSLAEPFVLIDRGGSVRLNGLRAGWRSSATVQI